MKKIAILGGGNIGKAIARGLIHSAGWEPGRIFVTRRNPDQLKDLRASGIRTGDNNVEAIMNADIILLTVRPRQLHDLFDEIREAVDGEKHLIGSVITSYTISDIEEIFGKPLPLVRVMPNTAVEIGESMTCIAGKPESREMIEEMKKVFDRLGTTLVISEELISASTILGACGIAFFLRAIRAVTQGGIQIGFHAEEAQLIASQTARGAASLLLQSGHHPEDEIDRVTTPRGCTIAGLNEMEHYGLSSALIKGIIKSYEEIENLK